MLDRLVELIFTVKVAEEALLLDGLILSTGDLLVVSSLSCEDDLINITYLSESFFFDYFDLKGEDF